MPATDPTFLESSFSNPFATRFICPGARSFLKPGDGTCVAVGRQCFDSIAVQLRSARRGLIIGPHGTGKSTLVQALLPTLFEYYPSVVQTRLNRYSVHSFRSWIVQHIGRLHSVLSIACQSPRGGLVIIDGLEQIPAIGRAFFCVVLASRGCDLLATSHHRMFGFAELYRTHMTPSLISQLLTDLTADCSDDFLASIDAELARRDLSQITNARDLWFDLYDVIVNSPLSVSSVGTVG